MIQKLFDLFRRPTINIHFNHGPFLEIESDAPTHHVRMLDAGVVIHEADIEGRHWTRANRRYFTPWKLELLNARGQQVFEHAFDLKGRRVRINIDSRSLGDTLAWLPQVQAFAERHPEASVYVSQFWSDLFDQAAYPQLAFIQPDSIVTDCYATYDIGYYFDNPEWHHPEDPRLQPLGKIASDILGLPYQELKPALKPRRTNAVRDNHPVVCIATASTAECKHWLYPGGWQTVVDHLVAKGFEVVVIQKEDTNLERVTDETGDRPMEERIARIAHSTLFIGLGSGLSWLAWALDTPVVLISGFSEPYAEFQSGCERVINRSVCHGCWNDPAHVFDRGDWHWCPRHAGTDRQFECSREIAPASVIAAVDRALSKSRRPAPQPLSSPALHTG